MNTLQEKKYIFWTGEEWLLLTKEEWKLYAKIYGVYDYL